ncbi:MAG: regulatory protein RecX [Candidatus Aceula lacicola]|nr:regulatory protein RecX [Candidatus Aceula lacicola]
MIQKKNKNEIPKAKIAAFRLLKVRIRSEKELKSRLAQRNFSSKVINSILRGFKQIGLINDQDFAKSWIQSRIAKGFGERRIVLELKQKGISDSIIKNQIQKTQKTYSPKAVIRQLIEKRLKRYKSLEPLVIKRRLYGFLVRRGFDINIVLKEIHNI